MLEKINSLITNGAMKSSVTIPYVDIEEGYFKPFTGVVLISKAATDVYPGKKKRFYSEHGEESYFSFLDNIEIVQKKRDYVEVFDVTDPSLVKGAGNNPLVLNIKRVTKDGGIVSYRSTVVVNSKSCGGPQESAFRWRPDYTAKSCSTIAQWTVTSAILIPFFVRRYNKFEV